ncbi:MAG: GatB/YqeY domain-containing protein [Candidatus Levyibacteriota bacterium]
MNKQKLQEELKQSMLNRNELKTSVLRLLLSAINYYEIQKGTELWQKASSPASEAQTGEGGHYQATEDDILHVIQNQAKQRRDSIEEFKKANRQELVDKEIKELEILSAYLPAQMSEEKITELVKEEISQTGAVSMADMGKVMGVLMPKVKGKADGNLVSKIVRENLA